MFLTPKLNQEKSSENYFYFYLPIRSFKTKTFLEHLFFKKNYKI
jgi:hypothetical protein